MKKQNLLYIAGFLLALNIFAWKEVFVLYGNDYLEVIFLDVGQGDSAFIETPQGHQILIDGGPTSAVLEKLQNLMPFWDRNLDLVILTHPESDHMQGLMSVLQRYDVDYVLWTGIKRETPSFKKWVSLLDEKQARSNSHDRGNFAALNFLNFRQEKTKTIIAKAGTKIKAGSAKIDILYPFKDLSGKEFKNTSNDTAVVSKLIYGKDSFLFTGDISSKAEKELAQADKPPTFIKADVLKVAHHGSKYSSSELFLKAVGPEFAVISVGKNSYGHPTSEVLQRLEKYDIKVLRTDTNGDIKFISNGNGISNF